MSKGIGRLCNLGLIKEASRGAGGAPTYWLPRTSFSLDERAEKVVSEESLGVIEDAHESYVVARYGEGDIAGEIRDASLGLLLYGLLGTVSSAVLETTAYNHTFTLAQTNSHQSLGITVDDPLTGQDIEFRLAMLNSLSIEVALGEIVKYASSFISRPGADVSRSATYTAENKFTATHARVKIAADLASLGAASALSIKSVKANFGKNVMRDHTLGTATPEEIHNQQFSADGELMLNLENETYKDYMLNNSYRALRIEFINTGVTIGASSNPAIQINFPRVHFYDWEGDRVNDAIGTQKLNFKALRDVSGGNAAVSSIVLTNTAVSY